MAYNQIFGYSEDNSITKLDTDVLILLFQYFNVRDIESCSKTCVKWKNVAVDYFFRPHLKRLAKLDEDLKTQFHNKGWSEESNERDLIISLFDEFKSAKGKYRGKQKCFLIPLHISLHT